jgi:hypothetical protein
MQRFTLAFSHSRHDVPQVTPLNERGTTMWAKKVCLALSLIFAGPALAQAQTGRITGTVVDSATTQPVANARVSIVGTTILTGTNSDGQYTINNAPVGTQTLRFTRIGFAPVTRTVTVGAGATAQLNVAMTTQAVQLNPVVSVGYGTQRLSECSTRVRYQPLTRCFKALRLEFRSRPPRVSPVAQSRFASAALHRSPATPSHSM